MLNPEQTQEYDIPETLARPLSIKTRELTKAFNGEVAVNKIDLEVPEGAIFGFIGPSGSGKTTTVRLLMGLYEPDAGEISVLGKRPAQFKRHDRERHRLSAPAFCPLSRLNRLGKYELCCILVWSSVSAHQASK